MDGSADSTDALYVDGRCEHHVETRRRVSRWRLRRVGLSVLGFVLFDVEVVVTSIGVERAPETVLSPELRADVICV